MTVGTTPTRLDALFVTIPNKSDFVMGKLGNEQTTKQIIYLGAMDTQTAMTDLMRQIALVSFVLNHNIRYN